MIKIRHATISFSAMGALAVAAQAQQPQPSSPNAPSQAPSQSTSGSSTTTTTTSRPAASPSPDLNTDTNSQPDITGTSGHADTDVRMKGSGGLASAMANFSVRTGLEIRPNSIGQVVVQTVRPDTASARAGIEPGDIITNLNGTEITTIDSLQTLISKQPSQGAYFASFRRGDKDFRVPLGRQLSLMGMTLFPDRADRPIVKAVEPSSPADRAGFKVGDVITGVDRQDTATLAKLLDFAVPFMRNLSQGQGIRFRVVRDGKPRQFSVTRPADADLPVLTPDQERHLRRVANGDDERPSQDHKRPRTRKTTRTTQTTAATNSMNNQTAQQPNQNGVGGFGG
ncbi:MAG TPA: PDZ domain-containing protein, partial [Planctomycetaceae bacterium]|nr:PDZ domain-containing protein [Planctomycetaceae bacterium]